MNTINALSEITNPATLGRTPREALRIQYQAQGCAWSNLILHLIPPPIPLCHGQGPAQLQGD